LRFMWLLLGTVYFFPGWWKLTLGRMEWLNGTYIKHALYACPTPLPWLHNSVLYEQPLLLIVASVAVVLFELSFIVMVFHRTTRYIATLGGLLFHNLCLLFIHIGFLRMQACYCALIEWSALFDRLGRRIFPSMLHVRFDGSCVECRSLTGALQVMDIFGRVRFHRDKLAPECDNVQGENSLPIDLHTAAAHDTNLAPQMMPLLTRVPLIWPLLPLLAVRDSARGTGGGRTDHLRLSTVSTGSSALNSKARCMATALIGMLILTGNILKGSQGKEDCLPVSCFPMFLTSTVHQRISVDSVGGGISHKIVNRSLPYLPSAATFIAQVCGDQPNSWRQRKLRALWNLMAAGDERCQLASKARFFKETYTTEPNAPGGGMLQRQLIGEIDLQNQLENGPILYMGRKL